MFHAPFFLSLSHFSSAQLSWDGFCVCVCVAILQLLAIARCTLKAENNRCGEHKQKHTHTKPVTEKASNMPEQKNTIAFLCIVLVFFCLRFFVSFVRNSSVECR